MSKQLATSDTDVSTQDETPAQQPAPIEAPPASAPIEQHAAPSTSAGAVADGIGGEDAFVRQLREQLSVEQQGSRPAGRIDPTNTDLPGMLSWQNPQIHLQPVSVTGSCYDITDFVDTMPNETDKVVSSNDDYQLICRSGPKKPKLENLAVNQWSVANISPYSISLYRTDGTLPLSQTFDYMSYTTYLYRLMNVYDLVWLCTCSIGNTADYSMHTNLGGVLLWGTFPPSICVCGRARRMSVMLRLGVRIMRSTNRSSYPIL